MKKLLLVLFTFFLTINSLSAQDTLKSSTTKKHKMTKVEFIKRLMERRQKTKALEVELKKEQEKTKALKKMRQALEKAKNQKTTKK